MMGAHWHEFEEPNSNLFKNKMVVYIYVFGTFMKYRIGGNVDGSLIIAKEKS